jgi:hypothetical protein
MEHRHARPCATQVPPSARPSNRRTDRGQVCTLGKLPLNPLPDEHEASTTPVGTKVRQDTIRSQALYTGTMILCKNPCSIFVSRLPLVYKRRKRTPGCRGDYLDPQSFAYACSPDISTRVNHLAGTWRLLLLSCLSCSPLYRHHGAPQYSATSATCWTYGPVTRTRIKLVSLHSLAPTIERPITMHFTS